MNVLLFHNVSLFIFFSNRIIYNTNRNGKCSGCHTQFKLKREKHEVIIIGEHHVTTKNFNKKIQNYSKECNLYLKEKLEY